MLQQDFQFPVILSSGREIDPYDSHQWFRPYSIFSWSIRFFHPRSIAFWPSRGISRNNTKHIFEKTFLMLGPSHNRDEIGIGWAAFLRLLPVSHILNKMTLSCGPSLELAPHGFILMISTERYVCPSPSPCVNFGGQGKAKQWERDHFQYVLSLRQEFLNCGCGRRFYYHSRDTLWKS